MNIWIRGLALTVSLLLVSCKTAPTGGYVETPHPHPVPLRADRNGLQQFVKSDSDRLADICYSENTQSLKTLMLKLYKRNPAEARKSGLGHPEQIAAYVFDPAVPHHWQFAALSYVKTTAAIQLAFQPHFEGDRILALMVGLQSMLYQAFGNKTEFYLTDSIEPQNLYNAARNIEIAMWKLANSKSVILETADQTGPMLLSNEIQGDARNLSFEREFAKVIARTDLMALLLAEKSQRLLSRLTQSITTANFIPF